jgi:hypothetical protein
MARRKIASLTLGKRLRELRKQKGVKSTRLMAEKLRGKYSAAGVLRREIGKIQIDLNYVEAFCKALGLQGPEREAIMVFARSSILRAQGNLDQLLWDYWELRKRAKVSYIYTAALIPTGLQTIDYARATIEAYGRNNGETEALALERLEWARQSLLDTTKRTCIVCSESALYMPVGTPQIMIDQLSRVRDFEDIPTFEFRILPNSVFLKVPLHELFLVFDQAYSLCDSRIGALTSEDPRLAPRLSADFQQIWSLSVIGIRRTKMVEKAIAHFESLASSTRVG